MNIDTVKNLKINFILTTARSGSTLLSLMLYSHPNTTMVLEEPFAYSLYPKYSRIKKWTSETIQAYCNDFFLFSEGKLKDRFISKEELIQTLEKYKEHLTIDVVIKLTYFCFFPTGEKNKEAITMAVDKQLTFHSCINDVAQFYPNSKFIILYRDPRDNAYAKWNMHKRKGQNYMLNYYRLAYDWKYTYDKLITAKNKIGTDRFLDVKYEDLVSKPEEELQKICLFLGLTYTDEMLRYNEIVIEEQHKINAKANKSIELIQKDLEQKPHTNKIGYYKEKLTAYEANLVWTICGDTAKKIGYVEDANFRKINGALFKHLPIHAKVLLNSLKTNLYFASPYWLKHWVKNILYKNSPKKIKWIEKKHMFGNS